MTLLSHQLLTVQCIRYKIKWCCSKSDLEDCSFLTGSKNAFNIKLCILGESRRQMLLGERLYLKHNHVASRRKTSKIEFALNASMGSNTLVLHWSAKIKAFSTLELTQILCSSLLCFLSSSIIPSKINLSTLLIVFQFLIFPLSFHNARCCILVMFLYVWCLFFLSTS